MPKTAEKWFYRFSAVAEKQAELLIYDMIGKDYYGDGSTVEAKKFIKDLKNLGDIDDLSIRINSPGGSVFEGNAIFNALKAHKAAKTVYIDGLAASMASIIAMVGDKIIMPENALMMIHNPWALAIGDDREMTKMSALLKKMKDSAVSVYSERSGQSSETVASMMDDETWMTASEALALGFCDEMGQKVEVAACFDLSRYKNTPPQAALLLPKTELPPTEPTDDGDVKTMDKETLMKDHPNLAQALIDEGVAKGKADGMKEGAESERARIKDVQEQARAGYDDLITEMMFDGKSTGGDAAKRINAAEKETLKNSLANQKADAPKPVAPSASDENVEDDPMKADTPLTMAEAEAIYNSNDRVNKMFSSAKNFFHFRKNAKK